MTATPLAMHAHAHPFSETSFVIQWHVLGMFAPSFFTGSLINRWGVLAVLMTGAVATLLCVIINLSGTSVTHFWIGLFLLGIGWNFLFIGATTLLTKAYLPEERFKTQALNDFIVFSMVATASLSAGMLQHNYGWRLVNYAALPAIAIILLSLAWLYTINKQSARLQVNAQRESS
jgi:MFS family permease